MKNVQQKDREKNTVLLLFALFLGLSLVWGQQTSSTWDDDAVGRYMNTADAGNHPGQFLSSWNRPLFVVTAYIPVHFFGRTGLVVLVSLLTAFSGLLLYKALCRKGEQHAVFAVYLLYFQTYLFGITRDAMTEPLVSAVICLGLYLYYSRKYIWLTITGSMLPLCRPEMLLLLPFWGYPIYRNRQWKYLPLLGTGLFLWWAGWLCYSGNAVALFDELLQTGSHQNRYGHTQVTHQFGKYIFVTGPITFYFFSIGLLTRVRAWLQEYFIMLQFAAGFVMYTVFSAFLDIGQSGGALRNLISLAPFTCVIALWGIQYLLSVWEPTGAGKSVPSNAKASKRSL